MVVTFEESHVVGRGPQHRDRRKLVRGQRQQTVVVDQHDRFESGPQREGPTHVGSEAGARRFLVHERFLEEPQLFLLLQHPPDCPVHHIDGNHSCLHEYAQVLHRVAVE